MRNILGQQNHGTLFFFDTQGSPLPRVKEVKRLLNVSSVQFFKARGWYRSDIWSLQRSLDIVNKTKNQFWRYQYRGSYPCDYVMVVPEIVKNNALFTMKYSQILVTGFRLGPTSLSSLTHLQDVFFTCGEMRQSGLAWNREANRNAKYIVDQELTDPTIRDVDFAGLAQQMSAYGDMAVVEARNRIKSWLDCHFWAQDTVCQSILDDIAKSQQVPSEELAAA